MHWQKKRQLVLMEAVKTAYCPGFVALQELLNQGVIGCIHDVEACFTKIGSAAGREIWEIMQEVFWNWGVIVCFLLPVCLERMLRQHTYGRFKA